MLPTHFRLHVALTRTNARSFTTFENAMNFRQSGRAGQKRAFI